MEDPSKFKQMQDEMSRFEAEISGVDSPSFPHLRPIIGVGTYNAVQQQLDSVIPPPPAPPGMMPGFAPPMNPMMMPVVPPPPPPPAFMVPPQVRRLQQHGPDRFQGPLGPNRFQGPPGSDRFPGPPGPMPFMTGMPGPQLIPPPPPKPQPIVLAAAPKLYKQPKEGKEEKKTGEPEAKKKKKEPPPPPPPAPAAPPVSAPPPAPAPAPPTLPAVTVTTTTEVVKPKKEKKHRKVVVRTGGGQVWEDVTLLDWPDDDFRMFCGDLGNDVTDELLIRTFSKYSSFIRAKVIRDKRTNKSKGFGFVSFKEPADFIKAMKEMDGRYVGSRPIKLRKSTWRNRSLDVVRKKEKEKAALLSMLMAGKG